MKSLGRLLAALVLMFALAGAALPVAAAPFWTEGGSSANLVNVPSFAPLVEKATPAVVTVYTKRVIQAHGIINFGPQVQQGAGSGFIISKDGYILTSYHVVKESDSIKVSFGIEMKKDYDARLIGADPDIDLALIKIEADNLPVLPLGDSDRLKVGDWVACIGSPFNFTHTFTVGVVSARGRRLGLGNYDAFIQTDASINAGNSGGPMINMQGEAVGINTLIISPSGGNVGIGFSTPINLVKTVLPQLKETGKVVRSWLGVQVEAVTEAVAKENGLADQSGARVASVMEGSPAEKAGIQTGDIIISFNGQPVKDSGHLPGIISTLGVGRSVEIGIVRKGQAMTRTVTLEMLPGPKELGRLKPRGQSGADNPLGVGVRETAADEGGPGKGAVVAQVAEGSPGAQNDLRTGDIITKINGADIKKISDYQNAVKGLKPGSYVRITLKRGQATITRVFKLEAW